MRKFLIACLLGYAFIGWGVCWAFLERSEDGSITLTKDEVALWLTRNTELMLEIARLRGQIKELKEELKEPPAGACT